MRIAPNAKCQRVLVLGLWLVRCVTDESGFQRCMTVSFIQYCRVSELHDCGPSVDVAPTDGPSNYIVAVCGAAPKMRYTMSCYCQLGGPWDRMVGGLSVRQVELTHFR